MWCGVCVWGLGIMQYSGLPPGKRKVLRDTGTGVCGGGGKGVITVYS